MHASDNARDRTGADELLGLVPAARRIVVPRRSTHNVFLPALEAARLSGLLELIVLGDAPPRRGRDGASILPRYPTHPVYAKPSKALGARLMRRLGLRRRPRPR